MQTASSFVTNLREKLRQNAWLIRTCKDLATLRALKQRSATRGVTHEPLHLRGLDRPVLVRPGATDVPVVWELFYGGEYSCSAGWPFRVVVDCGANVGLFLAWALRETGGALERYVGVEPDPSSFETLKLQVSSLDLEQRARLVQAAVWHEDGHVSFDDEGPSWGHAVRPSGGRQVRACTMNTILDEAGIEHADLIKIDIEGGERQLLDTFATWSQRTDAIVVELHAGLDDAWLAEKVMPHGFRAFATGALFRDHPGAVRVGSRVERQLRATNL